MVCIYILNLECDKLYVGRTTNIGFRLDNHFNSKGSFWTVKYKPISVKEVYNNCTNYDEDKYTIMMMSRYGIDNVRGGSFTRITLSEEEIMVINRMINNASDNCFKCYMSNHYINECPYKEIIDDNLMILRKTLIDNCKKMDKSNNGYVNVYELIEVLKNTDDVIFKDMNKDGIYKICDKINKKKDNGIKFINYICNIINYIDFCVGITLLMNEAK
ncbi:GIY-YIg endonuclease [Fadolivirus algeromassiliense]|jgi:hypothetical protein|uniref:GIY-YIg endonuclease n=1 Tax=Fadolivirus FV1/VV64 TaxID=3070911 RepID=A0A7D3V649_9VIRU|nr:GIY-YIg endonuclease [Fadolivirus algeromassiliense]QKF94875.1 GIY-YIg endonuclease [Fadolivirus FV1/VV64]